MGDRLSEGIEEGAGEEAEEVVVVEEEGEARNSRIPR